MFQSQRNSTKPDIDILANTWIMKCYASVGIHNISEEYSSEHIAFKHHARWSSKLIDWCTQRLEDRYDL